MLRSSFALDMDFGTRIKPALAELQRLLGPGASRRDVIRLVLKGPVLITCGEEKLRDNWAFLLGEGLTEAEARELLWLAPQVFSRTLYDETMRAKLRYWAELGIAPAEMLAHQRSYLKEGLAKVDQRVSGAGQLSACRAVEQGSGRWLLRIVARRIREHFLPAAARRCTAWSCAASSTASSSPSLTSRV